MTTTIITLFARRTGHISNDKIFFSLGFSVTVFCIEAGLAIAILFARRSPAVGGELGGPKLFKTMSSSAFVFFWVFYVAISAMEAYGVIKPGF